MLCLLIGAIAGDYHREGIDKGSKLLHPTAQNANPDTIIDPLIDWPLFTGTQQTGTIVASFDCFGSFNGYNGENPEVPEWPVAAFDSPPGSGIEYLWGGGIWVGGIIANDTLVSTGIDLSYSSPELLPPGYRFGSAKGSVTSIQSPADYSMRALFTDTLYDSVTYPYWEAHRPLGLRMTNRSHIWREPRLNNTIIYDLTITNIGDDFVQNGYVGFFLDCDVHQRYNWRSIQDDMAGSIREHGIGYAIDNDGDPVNGELIDTLSPRRAFAFKFLELSFESRDTSFNWFNAYWLDSEFGPRMRGTAEHPFREFANGYAGIDADRYYLMSKPEWDYDQVMTGQIGPNDPVWLPPDPNRVYDIANGTDIRFLISIGPFELLPDSSIRVLFATFAPDSVIARADLADILRFLPEYYSQTLRLDRLIETGQISDSLAGLLLDPLNPVTGLSVAYSCADSTIVEWDPWVFSTVEGYEVYVTRIPVAAFPYPGVVPPWYYPAEPVHFASVGQEPCFTLESLPPPQLHCVQVAHRSAAGIGDLGQPLLLQDDTRPVGPRAYSNFAFITEGGAATIRWSRPSDMDLHHYVIYKFAGKTEAFQKYHAFYDLGFVKEKFTPADSFLINDTTYYYYQMEMYDIVHSSQNEYVDYSVNDGEVYAIAAVDSFGFESHFSDEILVETVKPRTRDVLVLTNSGEVENFVKFDTVRAFYETILEGYDFAVYNVHDSTNSSYCYNPEVECLDWHEFTSYRLLIIDDGMRDEVLTRVWELRVKGLTKYLSSGGHVAYFGSLSGHNYFDINTPAAWYPAFDSFTTRMFAVDSLFYAGAGHFLMFETPPFVDTAFGFSYAESVDAAIPSVHFDPLRYPFTSGLPVYWPSGTPPSVSAFVVGDSGEVIQRYRSYYPEKSIVEGAPVGVRSLRKGASTYLFGYHLWYMNIVDARELVGWLLDDQQVSCCVGFTGNVDGSPDDLPDIGDLTALVNYLFITNDPLACYEEGNIDGDPDGVVDLADLMSLIDHLFISTYPTAYCQ
jgi:hypothetical protein